MTIQFFAGLFMLLALVAFTLGDPLAAGLFIAIAMAFGITMNRAARDEPEAERPVPGPEEWRPY